MLVGDLSCCREICSFALVNGSGMRLCVLSAQSFSAGSISTSVWRGNSNRSWRPSSVSSTAVKKTAIVSNLFDELLIYLMLSAHVQRGQLIPHTLYFYKLHPQRQEVCIPNIFKRSFKMTDLAPYRYRSRHWYFRSFFSSLPLL